VKDRQSVIALAILLAVGLLPESPGAQDRLKGMPGYEQYQKMSTQLGAVTRGVQSGQLSATWSADGKSFEYNQGGRRFRYDVAARSATDIGVAPEPAAAGARAGAAVAASSAGVRRHPRHLQTRN
jgi:dipeptidyl-peptidase-4